MRAFERALALTGRAPDVLSEYGEILVLAHGGRVAEPARRAIEEVLRGFPAEPRARYYLGLAKAQRGDPRGALQDWVDLIAMSPPDAPWLADIRREIRGVAAAAGIDAATLSPSAGLPDPAVRGLGEEDVKAAAEMSPEERDAMIRAMVEGLAQRLEDEPGDADGWRRLARAYEVLGESEKAKEALARAEAAEKASGP
jgi:cytochrome c-type biogenesis protein CcmH